jgi:hypothetical protein
MTTTYIVVLAMKGDVETWRPCGEISAPVGTKRQTIIDRVLEGQIDPEEDAAVGPSVPQLGLEDGAAGELLLIPAGEVDLRLPVRAARRYGVSPAFAQSETAPEEVD